MPNPGLSFLREEHAAVTTDWMVLTAIAVSFGTFVLVELSTGTGAVSTAIETKLTDVPVIALGLLAGADPAAEDP